jgi:hypothetical protein
MKLRTKKQTLNDTENKTGNMEQLKVQRMFSIIGVLFVHTSTTKDFKAQC